MLLEIEEAIANNGNSYYKIGQILQIGAKFITNWGIYYKLAQLLQIWAYEGPLWGIILNFYLGRIVEQTCSGQGTIPFLYIYNGIALFSSYNL